MQVINIHQAKTNLSQLIEKALRGENVIIAKAGKPIVKLGAYKEKLKPRKPGLLKGKISIPNNFTDEDPEMVSISGFEVMPIILTHILELEKLPQYHSDPFDRILIAQTRAENLVLITDDIKIKKYDVKIFI